MPRLACFLAFLLLLAPKAHAQPAFDAAWFGGKQPYVKIGVVEDGVYHLSGADLQAAGVSLAAWPAARVTLLDEGRPVPLLVLGNTTPTLAPTDTLVFAGQRNRGRGEGWAYDTPASQSSAFYSLYSDTTYYWLTVGEAPGPRYAPFVPPAAPTPTLSVRDTLHLENETYFYAGDSNDSGSPFYTRGEAYYHHRFSLSAATSQRLDLSIPLPDLDADGTPVNVRVHLSGGSRSRHRNTLLVGGTQQDEADWQDYVFKDLTATVAAPAAGQALAVRVEHHNEFAANPNIVYLDYVEVAYQRYLSARNGQLTFTAAPGAPAFKAGGFSFGQALTLAPALGRYAAVTLQNDSSLAAASFEAPTKLFAARRDALRAPVRVQPYQHDALADPGRGADYVILTTPALEASAQALAALHQARHGYRVAIVHQQDVFDQFDYGRPTPLALRRFVHATQAWQTPPQFLTLWGDALVSERTRPVQPWEVIAYGNAVADGWIAMNHGGPNDWSEVVAVGRLPLRTNAEGEAFVTKVGRYLDAPPGAWQRRSLQGSGGYSELELITLGGYTRAWASLSASSPVAQDTSVFRKATTDKVTSAYRERITEAFREGTSWFSFFGHSSTQLWEVVTDPPGVMRNGPALPVLWSFGCRTGNFSIGDAQTHTRSLAEEYVTGSPYGAIAHWGSSELSTIGMGGLLGGALHEVVFLDTVRVLGRATQQTKRQIAAIVGTSSEGVKNLLQYSLVGDPGMPMRLPAKPNLHAADAGLAFARETPIVSDSTLEVSVTLRSFGLVPPDSVTLTFEHAPPARAAVTQTVRLAPFADSVVVPFTVTFRDGDAGAHRFTATVAGPFDEEDLTDNRATRTLPVLAGGLALVTPVDGDLAPATPTLRVTRAALTDTPIAFAFELDTTATFTSPARRAFETTGTSHAAWPLTTPLEAGRTYHWRARPDEPGAIWQAAAFTVRPDLGTAGYFAQGGALADADLHDLVRLDDGTLAFAPVAVPVTVTSERGSGLYLGSISVGPETYLTLTLGWGLVLLDGTTGRVKAAMSTPTYQMPASLTQRFGDPAFNRARLDSLLQLARRGDVVLGRSRFLGNSSGPVIEAQDRERLRALGSQAIDTLTYRDLWQMVARVGYPEQTREIVYPPSALNEVLFDSTLTFRTPTATMTSPPVGPARAWQAAGVEMRVPATATATFAVLAAATDSVLYERAATEAPVDLSGLDPAAHPRVRLRLSVTDTSAYRAGLDDAGRTPAPTPDAWYALFSRVPDLVLDARTLAAPDTVQQGAPWPLSVQVANLGLASASGVSLVLTVFDAQNRERARLVQDVGTVAAGDTTTRTFTLDTQGLGGTLRARLALTQAAAEPITFNNFGTRLFTVRGDATPPRFTILIDGEALPHDPDPIRNLQDPSFPFVGARPTIEIALEDENAFRPLADSSVFTLTLNGADVSLHDPDVRFEPAAPGETTARLVYTPDLSGRDTTYTLRLRAFDASGNEALGSPYQVHFRVQNALAIESVLPYPNPMTTRTTFAFRVKGADAAEITECRLRIYTLTGQPVREFDLVEDPGALAFGALRVGWNKLVWDGTDADGDRLATGVYLYRVFVRGAEGRLGSTDVERIAIIR